MSDKKVTATESVTTEPNTEQESPRAMEQFIVTFLKKLVPGESHRAGSLQVFPLRFATDGDSNPQPYLVLDEALQRGSLRIQEVSKSGQVPHLKAVNDGDLPVLLLVGDQLIGAKQNRILNTTVMLAPKSVEIIPVSCVEQGRWAYERSTFSSSGTACHAELRSLLYDSVQENLRYARAYSSDQLAVWGAVSKTLACVRSRSKTAALEQAYRDNRATLESLVRDCPAPSDAVGVAFAITGQIVGLEAFDQAKTLGKLWPKLLRSYGLDALYAPADKELTHDELWAWLQSHDGLSCHRFKPPGMGEDIRFGNQYMKGAALVMEGRVVHLQMFPTRSRPKGTVDPDDLPTQ
ncbi:MAG: hypothetical protein NZ700_00840 [Gemmataceae bacterium]|nr:hypothetical protein [Gemmataceae bacterium]MDW8266375.1 DUF6569 family protein [Gemmataceae bacterium]